MGKGGVDLCRGHADSRLQVDDAMVTRLRTFFDEDDIVELTGLIAFQNLSSKFMRRWMWLEDWQGHLACSHPTLQATNHSQH